MFIISSLFAISVSALVVDSSHIRLSIKNLAGKQVSFVPTSDRLAFELPARPPSKIKCALGLAAVFEDRLAIPATLTYSMLIEIPETLQRQSQLTLSYTSGILMQDYWGSERDWKGSLMRVPSFKLKIKLDNP